MRFDLLVSVLTSEELRNPLFWIDCAVEVTLKSGAVNSFVLVNKRVPYFPSPDAPYPILLSEVESIRPSPYAVPKGILETARIEGEEIHIGDSYYTVEAQGKTYGIDAYFDFRPESLFFKNGDVKGSELQKTHDSIHELISCARSSSDSITVTYLDGLWE